MALMVLQMLWMLVINLFFIGAVFLLMLPVGFFRQAAFAVLKRNFVGYFSNPTGYVFLCLFVLLTSFAAFTPDEFFTANLANLDQLNKYLPYVMLAYIPAITMSVWSEERRQGTDELLLTLPTTDFDIVIGKYFAVVLVFTVALLFSQLSNYAVLVTLTQGDLDGGLLFSTYLGYWFVGIAMLAIGMVASFLTNNLTVGFIFGVMFNAPLAFFSDAEVIAPVSWLASVLKHWSLLERFSIFGRGLISLGPVVYFLGIVIICLFLCLILIGRRHWQGGKDGTSLLGHFVIRGVAIVGIAIYLCLIVENSSLNRLRLDISEGKVSTLSKSTTLILDHVSRSSNKQKGETKAKQSPVIIDAFVGAEIPPEYAQTKYDLVSLLKEFDARGGSRIKVNLHTGMKPFSEEADLARKRFNIRPQPVQTRSEGAIQRKDVILGAAFTCGLDRVVVPFFDYGIPVEYELIRSINTVARSERKTIGVVRTDAALMGSPRQAGMPTQATSKSAIIIELEKQYDVEEVDPSSPITVWLKDEEDGVTESLRYDALLVVQPSSLGPQELANVVNAIKEGQPTAVFEDTMPVFFQVPGTVDPKQSQMSMFGGGQPIPKGDMNALWSLLQIKVQGKSNAVSQLNPTMTFMPDIVWQAYNPYPSLKDLRNNPEYLFIAPPALTADVEKNERSIFNANSPITANLQEVLIPFASPIMQTAPDQTAAGGPADPLNFEYLMETGAAGIIGYDDLRIGLQSPGQSDNLSVKRGREVGRFVLAAKISSKPPEKGTPADNTKKPIRAIYVADIDCLHGNFFDFRSRPDAGEVVFRFQNITFVLNAIDTLSGDDAYLDIRKRTHRHKTLSAIEAKKSTAFDLVQAKRQAFDKELDQAQKEKQKEFDADVKPFKDAVEELQKSASMGVKVDLQELAYKTYQLEDIRERKEQELNSKVADLRRKRDEDIQEIERATDLEIQNFQKSYKIYAVILPPIIPLLVGLVVFTRRRLREREGMSKLRRR